VVVALFTEASLLLCDFILCIVYLLLGIVCVLAAVVGFIFLRVAFAAFDLLLLLGPATTTTAAK
jgi:hypothetical protein